MRSERRKLSCLAAPAAFAALACIRLTLSGPLAAEEGPSWPRWRGPAGDGHSSEKGWNPKGLEGGPRLLWKAEVGIGYSSVAIQGARLYTVGMKGETDAVYCLDTVGGKLLWKFEYPNNYRVPQATPAADRDSVFALGWEGILVCLDRENGKLRWRRDLVADFGAAKPYYGFAGSPVVEGELVLLTADTAGLALDKATGRRVWGSEKPPGDLRGFGPYRTTGTGYSTPIVYEQKGRRRALVSSWKGICLVDLDNGSPDWLYSWAFYTAGCGGDPVVAEDGILLASDATDFSSKPFSVLVDLKGEEPRVAWKSPELWTEFSTPVIIGGYIYAGHGGPTFRGGSLRCVELKTGRLMWQQLLNETPGNRSYSLMAADGKLIILDDLGMLYICAASPEGYREISKCSLLQDVKKPGKFWTPPVLCGGRIYCRSYAGELLCIDVRT